MLSFEFTCFCAAVAHCNVNHPMPPDTASVLHLPHLSAAAADCQRSAKPTGTPPWLVLLLVILTLKSSRGDNIGARSALQATSGWSTSGGRPSRRWRLASPPSWSARWRACGVSCWTSTSSCSSPWQVLWGNVAANYQLFKGYYQLFKGYYQLFQGDSLCLLMCGADDVHATAAQR